MNFKEFDWLGLFGILVMLVGASMITYWYVINELNTCTSNSLDYSINQLVKESNITWEYAELNIYLNKEDMIPIASKIIDLTPKENLNNLILKK